MLLPPSEERLCVTSRVTSFHGRRATSFPSGAMSTTRSSNPFPKDTWRVIISGQFAEHEIYEKLHKKVKNIARLQEGADILTHKTITQEAAEIFLNQNTIHKFRHYRLALEDIGGDLRNFSCVKGFVKAIRDATIGKCII